MNNRDLDPEELFEEEDDPDANEPEDDAPQDGARQEDFGLWNEEQNIEYATTSPQKTSKVSFFQVVCHSAFSHDPFKVTVTEVPARTVKTTKKDKRRRVLEDLEVNRKYRTWIPLF